MPSDAPAPARADSPDGIGTSVTTGAGIRTGGFTGGPCGSPFFVFRQPGHPKSSRFLTDGLKSIPFHPDIRDPLAHPPLPSVT